MLYGTGRTLYTGSDPVKRVVATGTFDILHPGHVYYLEQSHALGDELHVIVARDVNVRHKPVPVLPEEQRLRMVRALKTVDVARLGDCRDMFLPIIEIDPAIITLGYNQHFDDEKLGRQLKDRGIDAQIVRIGAYEGAGSCGSRLIMERILAARCPDHPTGTD
jgi:FAD synthetase